MRNLPFRVVAREAERRLGEVVRAERAEVGHLGDLVGPDARARQLDHRAAPVLDRRLLRRDALGQLPQARQLLAEADERMHDLDERRLARARLDRSGRPHDRAHLHLVDLGPLQPEPAAAGAEHRVGLVQLHDPLAHVVRGRFLEARAETRAAAGRAAGSSPGSRPSPRRSPRSRTAGRATACRERRARAASSRARIISCTIGSRSGAMNMCSVRQRPMPSAPNSRALAASSGVSAFARTRSRRSSSAQPRIVPKFSSIAGGTSRTGPTITRPVPPSIVITSPTFSVCSPIVTVPAPASIESPSQPATHGFPIPRATTAACEVMPPCAVRTPRAWMRPWMSSGVVSQRTRITSSPALPRVLRGVGVEHDLAGRGSRRGVQPLGGDLHRRRRVDHRVQELVELTRIDPRHRLLAGDQPSVGHLDGDAEGRRRRALAGAGLQEVEPPLLDRELDVLHVAVVGLEPVERRRQLRVGLRQLGRASPRSARASGCPRRRPRPAR